MKKTIFIGLLLSGTFFNCSEQDNETANSEETHHTEQSSERVERVSKEEFSELIADGDYTIIDVRTPEEYNAGKLDGAINYDYLSGELTEQLVNLDKDGKYAIYSQSGGRSGKSLQLMKEQGFTHVIELEGGYGDY